MPSEIVAIAKARSLNTKIGAAAATYAAQVSCPTSCPFFDGGGCYAENGTLFSGVTKKLNDAAERTGATDLSVAIAEAAAIDAMQVVPGFPMRLHTVGDCRTDRAARIVAEAAERYMARGGGKVWTYTHAWRTVRRESWLSVSVLASCERPEHIPLALARGYAPSIVVDEFPTHRLYELEQGPGVLPCPAQTRHDKSCSDCRLCFDDQRIIDRGYAIGFAVHGTAFTIRKAKEALSAPFDERRRLTLRQLIPEVLAAHPSASNLQIARELGYGTASVVEMRARLEREGVL